VISSNLKTVILFGVFLGVWNSGATGDAFQRKLENLLVQGHANGGGKSEVWKFDPESGLSLGSRIRLRCLRHDLKFHRDGNVFYAKTRTVPQECRTNGSAYTWELVQGEDTVVKLKLSNRNGACIFAFDIDERYRQLVIATSCGQPKSQIAQFRYIM